MRSRSPFFVAAGLFAVSVLAWWLWPREPESIRRASPASESLPEGEPTSPAAVHATPRAEPSQPADVAPMADREETTSEPHDDSEHAPERTADLLLYAKRPMSAVPHHVIRAWGATDDRSQLGLVGAYVIVDPEISDAQLTKLCRDIQAYHRDANALSVRIFDSEEAATYDRHIDGGALKNQRQVATVTRDSKLREDSIHVRGERVEP